MIKVNKFYCHMPLKLTEWNQGTNSKGTEEGILHLKSGYPVQFTSFLKRKGLGLFHFRGNQFNVVLMFFTNSYVCAWSSDCDS